MTAEIIILSIIVSAACAVCGVFLVLRRMALMSDAVSHSIILGVVIGFFISKSLSSVVPIIGAVIAGLASVIFTEYLQKTRLVKSDAAIGLVFPAMFSAGVLLVNLFAGNIHIDTDAVLLGEIGLAPLDRIDLFGVSIPRSTFIMSIILFMNVLLSVIFFKELKLSTFDKDLAAALGFSPAAVNYGLMTAVSITCVGAFDSVGAVLVTALMIAPPAAALLLSDDLKTVLVLAALIASLSSVSGFFLADSIDGSISGAMAVMSGVFFAAVYLFSPKHGFIKRRITLKKLRLEFALQNLTVHLYNHRNTDKESHECREAHLTEHINWSKSKAKKVCAAAFRRNLIESDNGILRLLPDGIQIAEAAMKK